MVPHRKFSLIDNLLPRSSGFHPRSARRGPRSTAVFASLRQTVYRPPCRGALPLVGVLLALLTSLAFTSCSHTRYIPLPSSHSRDSLSTVVHKKVNNTYIDRTHTLTQRGDTIFKTDSIYVEKFTDIEVHDTIRVTQTDSVPYPVEVPVYIRQRNLYDRATSAGFWILLVGFVLFISIRSLVRYYNKHYPPVGW